MFFCVMVTRKLDVFAPHMKNIEKECDAIVSCQVFIQRFKMEKKVARVQLIECSTKYNKMNGKIIKRSFCANVLCEVS